MSLKTEQYVVNNYQFAKKAGDRFKMDPSGYFGARRLSKVPGEPPSIINQITIIFSVSPQVVTPNEFWKGGVYQAQNQYKLKFRSIRITTG